MELRKRSNDDYMKNKSASKQAKSVEDTIDNVSNK